MNKKTLTIILLAFVGISLAINLVYRPDNSVSSVDSQVLIATTNCQTVSTWISAVAPIGTQTITGIITREACEATSDAIGAVFEEKVKPDPGKVVPVPIEPEITGFPDIPGAPDPTGGIAEFIAFLYSLGLWLVGIIVFIQLTRSGVELLIYAGNASKLSQAKTRLTNAIFGIVLLLSSYVILNTINPQLVQPFFATCGEDPSRCIGVGAGQDLNP